jgi:hypothetical protein
MDGRLLILLRDHDDRLDSAAATDGRFLILLCDQG